MRVILEQLRLLFRRHIIFLLLILPSFTCWKMFKGQCFNVIKDELFSLYIVLMVSECPIYYINLKFYFIFQILQTHCIFQAAPNIVTPEQRVAAEHIILEFRKTKLPYNICKYILGE